MTDAAARPLPAAFHPGKPCTGKVCRLCRQNAINKNVREYRRLKAGLTVEEAELVTPWEGPGRLGAGVPLHHSKARSRTFQAASVKPGSVVPPCVHRGAATGGRVLCPTCTGSVELKVYACGLHGSCTLGRPAPGLACCRTCPDQAAGQPLSVTRIEGLITGRAGEAFNASLIRWRGELLLAYRTGWQGAQVHVARLGEDLSVRSNVTLDLRHPLCDYGCEDPRLFQHEGSLWLSFVGTRGHNGRLRDTHQMLTRLDDQLQAEEVFCPEYAQRGKWEKNHLYLSYREDPLKPTTLYCIYSIHPHVVLRVEGGEATEAYRVDWRPVWSGGALRGGASPVLVGDEWFCFFHGKAEDTGPAYRYSVGVYTFSALPPFRPLRVTPEPLYRPDCRTCPAGHVCCTFPSGAILENGRWLVSAGLHDHAVEILEFSHEEIDKAMVKVP